MDGTKAMQNQTLKTHKFVFASQIFLRILATAATLSATWIMLTSKQNIVLFGMVVDARYSYSSAFKFFGYANLTVCPLSALSLFISLILGHKSLDSKRYFCMFVTDLILTTLLMAGCAAATAIGYIGWYGNSHTGWMPICDNFRKFCDRITVSVMLSYFSVIVYLFLTISSAYKSRQIQI